MKYTRKGDLEIKDIDLTGTSWANKTRVINIVRSTIEITRVAHDVWERSASYITVCVKIATFMIAQYWTQKDVQTKENVGK
jgi:hypothetical protein